MDTCVWRDEMSKSNIESMMNDSDKWSLKDFDERGVVNQHAHHVQESDQPREAENIIEIDEDSAPPSAVAKQQEDKKKYSLSKKNAAIIIIGVILVATVVSVVFVNRQSAHAPRAVPIQPETKEVTSQFVQPQPQAAQVPQTPSLPSPGPAQGTGEVTVPPDAAQQPVSPASAPVMMGATPLPTSPAPAAAPSDTSSAAPAANSSETIDSFREEVMKKLAALEEENRRLKQELQRTQQRPAAPARMTYGSDVYRIYEDGIVIDSSGEKVPVAIGEATKRYGVLKKTNPANKSFVTDRGEFHAPRSARAD
jgi:hypothetical protein